LYVVYVTFDNSIEKMKSEREREWNVMDFGARANYAGPRSILREPSVDYLVFLGLVYLCMHRPWGSLTDCSFLHTTIYVSSITTCQGSQLESAQYLLADEPLLWLESLELGHISRLDTDVSFLYHQLIRSKRKRELTHPLSSRSAILEPVASWGFQMVQLLISPSVYICRGTHSSKPLKWTLTPVPSP